MESSLKQSEIICETQKPINHFQSAYENVHFRTPYKTVYYASQFRWLSPVMSERINIDEKAEVWQWTCPRGHRNWEPTNFHFWCAACARSHDGDPSFNRIQSARDGRKLSRAEIELVDREGNVIVPPRRVEA